MSIGVIYVVLVVSVYIKNTCGLHNVVRASQQTSGRSRNEPSESLPVVSAVLLECPKELPNSQQPKPRHPCEQQLMVNIRVNPSFHVEKCEKFLILDEVYDPRKRSKAKIMSPYLIEISRGEPVMMYPLEFTKTVKSDDLTPKSGILNCQNYMGKSKGNNDFRTANSTTTLTTKAANRPNPGNDPEQDSLNRVMDKITDAFSAAKQLDTANEDEEPSTYNDELIRFPDNHKSFQNLNSVPQTLTEPKILYDEYGSVNNGRKQFEPFRQTYDFSKRLAAVSTTAQKGDEKFKVPGSGYYTGEYRERIDIKNPSVRGCRTQSAANVGVPDKLFEKLEESGRHVAQLGSIQFSGDKQKSPTDTDSTCKGNLKARNTGNQDLHRKSSLLHVQRENGQKEDVHITDYSMTPIQSADLNQQQAEIHAEMEDDSDGVSPAGYMERSAPKFRKFRKFRGGRKRGHRKKQEKRPRKSNLNQQTGKIHVEDDEIDYEEDANPASSKEEGQQNVPDNQNTDDSETIQEQELPELFEKDEPTFVKPHVPSDLFENFEKISVITSGDRQQSPQEEEDEHYMEWEKKQHIPVRERIHYIPHDGDYRLEPIPLQEVDLNKRDNDEKNHFEKYTENRDAKLEKQDTQVELERTQVNINDNANYKPLEMPQYDYDEDNKQILLIHNNNKKFNSKKNMPFVPPKTINFVPTIENSLRNKNVQYLKKSGHEEGGNKQNLKSSKKLLESEKKNFEVASSNTNTNSVLNNVNKEFPKPLIQNNKLMSGLRKEKLKNNKYIENDYNFNAKDQNSGKSSFDLPPGLKNVFSQPHANKIESPKMSENRFEFKSNWNNANNDINPNNKHSLETTNTGVGFDVDEIIRHHANLNNYKQNYKLPVTMQSSENQARLLLNNEPPQYLPNRPPYSRIIDDPNLNIKDKLGVLDIIDTKNENAENIQNEVYKDILNSYVLLETPSPVPIEDVTINPKLINVRKSQDNSKKKRSFVFYDDLEMRDTLMDNDYNFDDTAQQRRDRDREQSMSRHVQEDVSPCATCGGKGKKPIQKNPAFNPQENACRCRNQRTTCNCPDSRKDIRSVSDAWYAVFNMSAPLPFLTTKLRIFRKRHNIWWKIVPSITLSSLSGIFANANLSILFSSHVDIFQLEKSLRLQNHQLLIPKDDRPVRQNLHDNPEIHNETPKLNTLNLNPSNILAIESPKLSNWNSMTIAAYSEGDEEEPSSLEPKNNYRFSRFAATNQAMPLEKTKQLNDIPGSDAVKKLNGNSINSVRTIAELGYFPTTMNLLEYCPNDRNRLCLNMLEDRVPAYSIKVKLPFRENALIHRHIFKVSIARIVTDATTMNVLQVSVDVINKGLFAHEFAICVCNCPMASGGAKNRVKKLLLPHVGETVTFLLPLILDSSSKKHKKFNCDVIIREAGSADKANKKTLTTNHQPSMRSSKQNGPCKQENDKIVSVRAMTVEPEFRCFCIWDCKCHCVPKLETYVDFHICQKMNEKETVKAGLISCEAEEEICLKNFIDDNKETSSGGGRFCWFVHNALILLGIVLVLGLLKALVGLASTKVDRWGYEYVQPTSTYEDSTKCRRFFVNSFFFIVFPFLFWCKCFTPSEEDLLVASTEWQCSLVQDSRRSSEDDDYDNCGYKVGKFTDEEEDVILSQHIDRKSAKSGGRSSGGADISNLDTRLNDWTLAFNEGVFDDDDDADEEANTKFVLQALVESRESLKKLLKNHGARKLDVVSEEAEPRIKKAEELVQSLKTARIVYRAFDRPVGNVRNIPFGIRYCVQGYFLPSLGSEFEFVNYNPMAQYRCISADGTSLEILRPPIVLCPQEFSRVYADPLDVLDAGDLFISPPPMTPCINITTMAAVASSVAKLASDHSCNGHSSSSSPAPRCSQLNTSFALPQHPYRTSTGEEDPSDLDLPSASQVALNISNMNEEMMNESMQQPIEDESIDLVDDASIEFTPHQCDTIEE